ncbi:hypothetical protein FJZ36_02765 [Candidatus Poribacteria bacterium]|nr:hypothetical protein [Candidatus Poribacteria bacterium]
MFRSFVLIGIACCLLASTAIADDAEMDDGAADGLSVSGYVDTTFVANVANPPSVDDGAGGTLPANTYFPYYTDAMSFYLGAAHVVASGASGAASYTVEIDAGRIAEVNSGGSLFDIQEAYASYGFGSASVTVGKFVTFEGIDLIESPDNPVITHGLLYTYAEPIYHVGAFAAIPIGEQFEARAGVANGWDRLVSTEPHKTLLARLGGDYGYLSWGLSGTFGKEGGDSERLSIDFTGSADATDSLSIGFQGNYGAEDVADESVTWMGAGLQPVFALSDKVTLSARGEWFKDEDGFRTGTAQTLISVSACGAYSLSDTTRLRVEARLDTSDEDVFIDADGLASSSQMVGAVQFVQSF